MHESCLGSEEGLVTQMAAVERVERVLLSFIRAARPEDHGPGELHGGVGGGRRGLVAQVEGDGDVPVLTNC